jgi:hypothetical protein
MRLERNTLFAVTLLLMAGCSANRQARQSDSVYDSPETVPMPMRHADEYDSGARHYEYDSAPFQGETPGRPGIQYPPAAPAGEPAQAPPAIGVSRVKSVSWQHGTDASEEYNSFGASCTDDGCCGNVQQSYFPAEYFSEGCATQCPNTVVPSRQCREKSTIMEIFRDWRSRAKTRRAERVRALPNSAISSQCDPGCFAPDFYETSVPDNHGFHESPKVMQQYIGGVPVGQNADGHGSHGGSLADPLQENGWTAPSDSQDARFSPDEMLELPSSIIEAPVSGQPSQEALTAPVIESGPLLPIPESAPVLTPSAGDHPSARPLPATEQPLPESVQHIVKPPKWHRLIAPAATSVNGPVVSPAVPVDSSLPMIQPGRRI